MDSAMKPVPRVLLVKAHVAAHTRKDGTQVRAYDTRVQARATPETKDWRDEAHYASDELYRQRRARGL